MRVENLSNEAAHLLGMDEVSRLLKFEMGQKNFTKSKLIEKVSLQHTPHRLSATEGYSNGNGEEPSTPVVRTLRGKYVQVRAHPLNLAQHCCGIVGDSAPLWVVRVAD